MAYKYIILLGLATACSAGYLGHGGIGLTLGASRSPIIAATSITGGGPAPGYTAPAQVAIHAPPQEVVHTRIEPYDPHPQYQFNYDVNDFHTGDSKYHMEHRNGDHVRGQYSLTDPDGTRRTVDYSADPHTGFNAVVSRQPLHPAPVPVPVIAHPQPIH